MNNIRPSLQPSPLAVAAATAAAAVASPPLALALALASHSSAAPSPIAPQPLAPAPPLAAASSCLRLGTFNVGLGFRRKLPAILTRCVDLALDIIALQEIGDPALPTNKLQHYSLVCAAGPSHQQGGVGLLVSHELAPLCRTYLRSKSGRLVGAVLEPSKGHRLLIVSAYMPTGLDNRAAADDAVSEARKLYSEVLQWTLGVKQVIVMGDLNETLTVHDRLPARAHARGVAAAATAPIQSLLQGGFTDVYRLMHADASRHPGFTHAIDNAAHSLRSRIDYILASGTLSGEALQAHIDTKLHHLSAHHLLWMVLQLRASLPPPCTAPLFHQQLPNLRNTTRKQREFFGKQIEKSIARVVDRSDLPFLAARADPASLNSLAEQLTAITRRVAFKELPLTGTAPYRTTSVLALEAQRRDLTRLLRMSITLCEELGIPLRQCPAWAQLNYHCKKRHGFQWTVDAHYHSNDRGWIDETRRIIRSVRSAISRRKKDLDRARTPKLDANPAAEVHRMLQSHAPPSELFSVVDSHGQLTSSAAELEDVMVYHFESVFAIPPADPAPLVPPAPACLFAKPGIDALWYSDLMRDVSNDELLALLEETPLVSAPGQDQVSTAVWRAALEHSSLMRRYVCALFNTCLSTSTFPRAWKTGIILPFIKDASKERAMGNIRPISLQSCLGKLFNKMLAYRLSSVFARHPILHPAQRGFVLGGTTVKCIDELLDAWDWSRAGQHELHTVFYDIKQAYDCVQLDVLVRALRRLHLPPQFVDLITDSLTGLESRVRTVYGESRSFAVQRSVRQGDPLAPLLFVVLMDALHDGLDTNPFTQKRHGCLLKWPGAEPVYVSSLGYADDTTTFTNSLIDLRAQNDWVKYFMSFNRMRLNPTKCELVGRMAGGACVSAANVALHDITVDGVALAPLPHDQPIRYLGVHMCFDGSWKAQFTKTLAMIGVFTRAIEKFRVSVSQAAYMFNVFLLPKMEAALHYAHGTGTTKWIKTCERLLTSCIQHAVGAPIQLKYSAVALVLGFHRPSWLEASIKVSELFLRMNSSDDRWGHIGRLAMQRECTNSVTIADGLPQPDCPSRLRRAARLAVHDLGWQLHLTAQHRPGSRHRHLFHEEPLAHAPSLMQCSSSQVVAFSAGNSIIAHDVWSGWGTALAPISVSAFTDGSYSARSNTSAWSVVAGDQWLDDNLPTIPTNEQLLRAGHVAGGTLVGAAIDAGLCTHGVFPAELQAIARALVMFPLGFSVHIHSDSQASIAAIASFGRQQNERKRMRMAARPLLRLIDYLKDRRRKAGGTVDLSHVKAHTKGADIVSVGNRLADYQADLARAHPDRSCPLNLRPLPITACERHLHALLANGQPIIDDIRRTSLAQLRRQGMNKWAADSDAQGRFACQGMVDLGRVALRKGNCTSQATLVRIATNSIHQRWVAEPPPSRLSKVQPLHCAAPCNTHLSIDHLAVCPGAPAQKYRTQLHSAIVGLLSQVDEARAALKSWSRGHPRASLDDLLLHLFPHSPPPATPSLHIVDLAEHRRRHLTLCMLGAFTDIQASSLARTLRLNPAKDALRIMRELRLLCLESIEHFFTPLTSSPV